MFTMLQVTSVSPNDIVMATATFYAVFQNIQAYFPLINLKMADLPDDGGSKHL
jgi:hypothetical protein